MKSAELRFGLRASLFFYILILLASLPFWALGFLLPSSLLPGLPVSALMFIVPGLISIIYLPRTTRGELLAELLSSVPRVENLGILFLMPMVMGMAFFFQVSFGLEPVDRYLGLPYILGLATIFLFSAFCEELAWTGVMLRRQLSSLSLLGSGFLIGLYGALWHLVPYLQTGQAFSWALGQITFTLVQRLLIVSIYRKTKRNFFSAILIHASYNLAWQLLPYGELAYDPWVAAGLTALALGAIELAFALARRRGSA